MNPSPPRCPLCKSTNCNRDWPSGVWLVLATMLLVIPPLGIWLFHVTPNRWCLCCGTRFRRDATGAFEPQTQR